MPDLSTLPDWQANLIVVVLWVLAVTLFGVAMVQGFVRSNERWGRKHRR